MTVKMPPYCKCYVQVDGDILDNLCKKVQVEAFSYNVEMYQVTTTSCCHKSCRMPLIKILCRKKHRKRFIAVARVVSLDAAVMTAALKYIIGVK